MEVHVPELVPIRNPLKTVLTLASTDASAQRTQSGMNMKRNVSTNSIALALTKERLIPVGL